MIRWKLKNLEMATKIQGKGGVVGGRGEDGYEEKNISRQIP